MERRPRLVCIPSADHEFAEHVGALFARVVVGDDQEPARAQFEALVRRRFPTSVVRPRHELAEFAANATPVWYVTRQPYRSRLSASVEIAASAESVFDLYVQPERIPEWQTAVHVTRLGSSLDLVGSEYAARYKVLGRLLEGRFRIVDAERPTYLRVEGQGGGIRLWYATTLTGMTSGTRVDVDGDYDVPANALGRLADRLFVERAVQRDVEYAHANLKALCELAGAATPAVDLSRRPATG